MLASMSGIFIVFSWNILNVGSFFCLVILLISMLVEVLIRVYILFMIEVYDKGMSILFGVCLEE